VFPIIWEDWYRSVRSKLHLQILSLLPYHRIYMVCHAPPSYEPSHLYRSAILPSRTTAIAAVHSVSYTDSTGNPVTGVYYSDFATSSHTSPASSSSSNSSGGSGCLSAVSRIKKRETARTSLVTTLPGSTSYSLRVAEQNNKRLGIIDPRLSNKKRYMIGKWDGGSRRL